MATLSTVVVDFIANTAKYVAGLTSMSKDTKAFGAQLKKDVDNAGKDLMKIGKYAAAAGAALYTGISVGVLKSVNELAKVNDEANKLGMSVEGYQMLGEIAKDAGVGVETLRTASVALTKSLNEVEAGNQGTIAAFNELGINADKLAKLTPEQKLAAVADAMKDIKDESDRTRLGMELFGKSWTEINVVLKDGSDAMMAAGNEAANLGQIMASEDVKSVKELQKSFSDLSDFVSSTFNIITAAIAPLLTEWINKFLNWLQEGNNLSMTMQNILYALVTPLYMIAKAVDGVISVFYVLKGVVQLVAAGAVQFITYFIKGITFIASGWEQLINLIIEGWNKLPFNKKIEPISFTTNLTELGNTFQGTVEELAKDADESFTKAGESWSKGFGEVVLDVSAKVSNALSGVVTRAKSATDAVNKGIKETRSEVQGVTVDYTAWYKLIEKQQALAQKLDPTIAIREEIAAIQELIAFEKEHNLTLGDSQYYYDGLMKKQADLFFLQNKGWKEATEYLTSFADQFANAIVQGENFGQALKNVFSSILKDIAVLIIRTTVLQVIMASIGFINPAAGQAFGVATGLVAKTAGSRAGGGPVNAGEMYRVGEAGPEFFVPSSNGYILPNDFQGGGEQVNVYQTINIQTGVAQTVRAEMLSLLPRFKSEAVAGVIEGRARGGSLSRAITA